MGRAAGVGGQRPLRKRRERVSARPIQPRLADLEDARIRRRLDGDFGADPGRIADGYTDSWFCH
jgi:hypothetical protein